MTDITKARTSHKVGGYTLGNLELEFETVDSQKIADEVKSLYSAGRTLTYEHVTLLETNEWDKDSTVHNENVNLQRKSMKAIVFPFTNKTSADSGEYVYPNIESVMVTIEGAPSSVYSQGIPKSRFYDEAKKVFGEETECDQHMTVQKFYRESFSLVIGVLKIEAKLALVIRS